MSLIYNGTTIDQTNGTVKFGTTEIEKIIYNGTTVWEKIREKPITDITGTFPNWRVNWHTTHSDNSRTIAAGESVNPPIEEPKASYGGIRYSCHSAGDGECWLSTGLFDRTGYNKLNLWCFKQSWSDDEIAYLKIANAALSEDRTICTMPTNTQDVGTIPWDGVDVQDGDYKNFDININSYFTSNNINMILGINWGAPHNAWMTIAMFDFKLYN